MQRLGGTLAIVVSAALALGATAAAPGAGAATITDLITDFLNGTG